MASQPGGRFRNGQYRLSTARWESHFAYMQDGFKGYVSSWNGDAGPQGWWQLINHPSTPGYYLMSTSKWPQCFIFMENGIVGNIRGWNKCDPGPQGYMKFVPHRGEDGKEDGFYLITPQRPGWEDKWFLYVESGMSGNLSSWSGDPGPQGWFKVEPWNINVGQAMHDINKTMRDLPAMPMLTDPQSGYNGPDAQGQHQMSPARPLKQPQMLSEIRLEATYSEGVDLNSVNPASRSIVLHVDQSTAFAQKIGRQHQETFFQQLVPQRDLWAALSRTIFELTLQPPATTPTLTKISKNMLLVGDRPVTTGGSTQVGDSLAIRIGGQEGSQSPPFLVLTVHCTIRRAGNPVEMTCANLGPTPMPAALGGYSSIAAAMSIPETRIPTDSDCRPQTMPQYPGAGGAGGGKAVLECVYSSGLSDLSRANPVIPLVADQEVSIGRLHQTGFFEKLLPDHDSLACISRKHLTARLHRGGHMVEIENVSRNTVTIDSRPVAQGQKGELREGSTLRFTALDKTLLEFRLKSEIQSGVPATRYG